MDAMDAMDAIALKRLSATNKKEAVFDRERKDKEKQRKNLPLKAPSLACRKLLQTISSNVD
ncbi:hypothetical protein [Coleofasciculus sp. FACHB-1120]|uniref:hypothetical protein n=1 Tax=Coleofasciculus sp. FACHB-1120 TaxID=2692783 RepID=UPI001687C811|nr:hypothetical protein [Coleofasciculus sp. FACHB-1120]MBD2743575.1 hypothetical protein [Coleofasciculus sp. FACHB-1120]